MKDIKTATYQGRHPEIKSACDQKPIGYHLFNSTSVKANDRGGNCGIPSFTKYLKVMNTQL